MNPWLFGIPASVALAAVALIGYLFGRYNHGRSREDCRSRQEVHRARTVIRRLESVAQEVRRSLAAHQASILRFKDRVSRLNTGHQGDHWKRLCREAERMLGPTVQLSTQIAHAYDEIRRQTGLLMMLSEVRTDPLTGLGSRRALDDSLKMMFAMMSRYATGFSLALIDIDHFNKINDKEGHLRGDQVLREVAGLLEAGSRTTDVVVRYGGEEFVILMPETDLEDACTLSERVRRSAEEQLPVTISVGLAAAGDGDNPRRLIARADSALYSAKEAGRNRTYRHTGSRIEPVCRTASSVESDDLHGKGKSSPETVAI